MLNGRHHAFVPHGSHGITFKDTIAKNTAGDAYWWDPAGTTSCSRIGNPNCTTDNSSNIIYDHALADGVSNGPGDARGLRLSGFLLGAGSGNAIRNSAAIGIRASHIKDCAGFHWPEHANQNVGGNVWTFVNNYSFSGTSGPSGPGGPSACHGIFVWQNDSNLHVIGGFTGGGIDHGAYDNHYEYANIDVPYVEIHAAGWAMRNGAIGTLVAMKHASESTPTVVITDVAVDRFVIQNADDGGEAPGEYVLNGSGLTCADIEYVNPVAGTRVILDGHECPRT